MALVTKSSFPLSEVSELMDPHPVRDPGHHVTDLIWMAKQLAKGKSTVRDEFEENNLMSWGRMWEASVRSWIADYSGKLGLQAEFGVKRHKDGIWANLDGRLFFPSNPDVTFAVLEMKATTKKDPDPTLDFDRDHQARSYCYYENTNLAWFLMLHCTRFPPDFQPWLYQIYYEDWEKEDTWTMVTRMKEYKERNNELGML